MVGRELFLHRWFEWLATSSWQLALFVPIIAVICWLLRHRSPRLRYALWLLVLVKVFLPPAFTTPWGIGQWAVHPLWETLTPLVHRPDTFPIIPEQKNQYPAAPLANSDPQVQPGFFEARIDAFWWLFMFWLVGAMALALVVSWRYARILRLTAQCEPIDEGPLRIHWEKLASQFRERLVPDIYLTREPTGPFLYGIFHPRLVISRELVEVIPAEQLKSILLHELIHWHRRDPWIGWVQVLAQCIFWFHPFVWWANSKIRHEREYVCDDAVLRFGNGEPSGYGSALLQVVTVAQGRSPVQGGLVGIFERTTNIQNRLEKIMNYRQTEKDLGPLSRLAIVGFALILLPMGLPPVAADQNETIAEQGKEGEEEASQAEATTQPALDPNTPPQLITTSPEVGATDVDPSLEAITVTFDRDMSSGMSWTGGGSHFPPAKKGKKPYWKYARTCVFPVQLKRASLYRVGINSTSFKNFQSETGKPAFPTAIYFTTEGASPQLKRQVRKPQIVELVPENNSNDVNPNRKTLRVLFDMPMGSGMSWTGDEATFPAIPKGKRAKWSSDGKTCILPVELEPNKEYEIGLNSPSHINFSSKWGVPLDPVIYRFKTKAAGK